MKAVHELDGAGLFKMEKMKIVAADKELGVISGLRMIDEEKLSQSSLTAGPALQLAYAHLFSKATLHYGLLAQKPDSSPDIGFKLLDEGELDIDWDKIKI